MPVNSILLGAIALDLFIVLMGSVITLLPVAAADILDVGRNRLGLTRYASSWGCVCWAWTCHVPPMRRSGFCLLPHCLSLISILVFAYQPLMDDLAALFVYGAADMVSVNIRYDLIQLATLIVFEAASAPSILFLYHHLTKWVTFVLAA